MVEDTIAMGLSGFTVAALAPGVILATRHRPLWQHLSVPGSVALPLFLLVHAAGTLAPALTGPSPVVRWLSEAAVLGSGFLFWLPVIGTRHRLSEPGRCLYLFLAAPALDIPSLGMMAMGHTSGGLAMILGMQPISVAALAVTWRWITTEGVPLRG